MAYRRILLGGLVLLQLLPAQARAETVYRWMDTGGVTHYSDTPPLATQDHSALELAPGPTTPGDGLRAGERAALRVIEQQLERQHRSARQARRDNDRAVAKHRRECRELRARQHATGYHAKRKADTTYLRRHCW